MSVIQLDSLSDVGDEFTLITGPHIAVAEFLHRFEWDRLVVGAVEDDCRWLPRLDVMSGRNELRVCRKAIYEFGFACRFDLCQSWQEHCWIEQDQSIRHGTDRFVFPKLIRGFSTNDAHIRK
jgi:hypothetical protein